MRGFLALQRRKIGEIPVTVNPIQGHGFQRDCYGSLCYLLTHAALEHVLIL